MRFALPPYRLYGLWIFFQGNQATLAGETNSCPKALVAQASSLCIKKTRPSWSHIDYR
jgi:hypothetical protein